MLPSFIGPQAPRRAIWQRVSALLISYSTLYIFNILQFEYALVHAGKFEDYYAVSNLKVHIWDQTFQTSKQAGCTRMYNPHPSIVPINREFIINEVISSGIAVQLKKWPWKLQC